MTWSPSYPEAFLGPRYLMAGYIGKDRIIVKRNNTDSTRTTAPELLAAMGLQLGLERRRSGVSGLEQDECLPHVSEVEESSDPRVVEFHAQQTLALDLDVHVEIEHRVM